MHLLRLVWLWLQIIGGTLAVIAICWLAVQYTFHLRLLSVQTGSMRPTFRPGDALVMQRQTAQPRVGEVVSYHSSRNPNELVTHRVVQLFPAARRFQTKGDQLAVADPVVRDSLLAGRVVAVLPGMGRVLGWLSTWPGLVVCVYIPAFAIAVGELIRFERTRARVYYVYRLCKPQVI